MAVAPAEAGEDVPDPVNNATYYKRFEIEPIKFIMLNRLSYAVGNVIKYVCRHDGKNGLEDILKAKWYLERIIEDYQNGQQY